MILDLKKVHKTLKTFFWRVLDDIDIFFDKRKQFKAGTAKDNKNG